MQQVIEGYAAAAPELIDRFNAVSSSELFKPMIDLLSLSRIRVLDSRDFGLEAETVISTVHSHRRPETCLCG
jgi:hypothetical protein